MPGATCKKSWRVSWPSARNRSPGLEGWKRRIGMPFTEAPWGSIRAGDIFAGWLVHDFLHMRQMLELHWAHFNQQRVPYATAYGGEW